jgi:hypothetical protein
MQISDLHQSSRDGLTGIHATVVWEDSELPRQEIFIQTTEAFGSWVTGSSRVKIESAIATFTS